MAMNHWKLCAENAEGINKNVEIPEEGSKE